MKKDDNFNLLHFTSPFAMGDLMDRYVCLYERMYVYLHERKYTCVCVRVCMYACMYVCIIPVLLLWVN